jgi:alpha-tubulin suppressor-like RCC1 family protein
MQPSRISVLKDIPIVAVCGGPSAAHCVAIAEDGRAFVWGRNDRGQLGLGDRENRQVPTELRAASIPEGTAFVGGACGKSHTVLLTSEGESYAFGSNKHGQLGIGSVAKVKTKGEEDARLTPVRCVGVSAASAVSCGAEFTAWICGGDGSVYTAGLPQFGQLGHGTDHEYNMAASSVKIAYDPQPMPRHVAGLADVRTIALACGQNHCVAVDANGKIWTWGNGGYGRLGHKVQRDAFSPTMVDIQGGDRNLCPPDCVVSAGSTSSWVTCSMGQMYCFGKIKTGGDNHMYPVPFLDLQGWNLRSFACGLNTFVACGEDQTIAWGQGGGCGELGYGESGPKSSANPKLIDSLAGKTVRKVAAGIGHSLFLIDKADAADLPVFEPVEFEAVNARPAPAAQGKKGGAKRKEAEKPAKGPEKKHPKKKKK